MNRVSSVRPLILAGVFLLGWSGTRAHAATFTVTNLSDGGRGSLREALTNANATSAPDTITFASGVKGTLTLTLGELTISSDVSLVGPGATNLTISGGNANGLFNITKGTVSLSGLTLANGLAKGKDGKNGTVNPQEKGRNGEDASGGAIFNTGRLTITECAFNNNMAQGGNGGRGGIGATGARGGGARGGAIFSTGTLGIVRTQFKNNTAQGGNGGASGGSWSDTRPGPKGGRGGDAYGGAVYGLVSPMEKCTLLSNRAVGGTGGPDSGASGTGFGNDVFDEVPQAQDVSFTGTASAPFQGQLPATGDTLTTYSLVSGELPPGLSLNSQTGVVSGTPTQVVVNRQVTFKVSNALGDSNTANATFTIDPPSLVVTTLADTVNPGDKQTSLREAVDYAHTLPGSPTVTFQEGLSGTIDMTGAKHVFEFSHDMSIVGPTTTAIRLSFSWWGPIFYVGKGTVAISNLTIAQGGGSAIVNEAGAKLVLSNCAVLDSIGFEGDGGAGLHNRAGGTVVLNNCTFANNNYDSGTGGAIYNSGTLTVNSCTITANVCRGGRGGGIYNEGTLILRNSIVAGNTADTGPNIFGKVQSSSYTLLGGDSKLGPLQSNGGPTPTFALLAGSPAIDAGQTNLTTDQRGFSRPFGKAPDIGAFELQTLPVISINSPSVQEGNSGTTALTFTLTLSRAFPSQVSVLVNTQQNTAKSGSDYQSVGRATVTFAPGTTQQTFTVQIVGDTRIEEDESLQLYLRSPFNATLATPSGTGTILNDDGSPKSSTFAGSSPSS